MYQYEIYQDKERLFRVRFRAPSRDVLWISPGWPTRELALAVVSVMRQHASEASVDDQTGEGAD